MTEKREKLVEFIGRVVTERFDSTKLPTNGALLAELVRAEFGENVIADAGFEKLSQAVSEAVNNGLINRNSAAKHLEVIPAGISFPSSTRKIFSGACYVRPDAWRAFGMQFQGQNVTFDKVTHQFDVGGVRVASNENVIAVDTPNSEPHTI